MDYLRLGLVCELRLSDSARPFHSDSCFRLDGPVRESTVEQYFTCKVREAQGYQRKFVSPGVKGVPDRIAVFDGWVAFVELKAPGKPLRADQAREHVKLRAAGANVFVIDSKEAVDYFIDRIPK
jgi:hypothetical protein